MVLKLASVDVLILFLIAAFFLVLTLTWRIKRHALVSGMIDRPNERSSHQQPTPRGGGLAIAIVVLGATATLTLAQLVDHGLGIALTLGGVAIAFVGYLDDRNGASVKLRISIHFAAAVLAVYCLGGVTSLFTFGAVQLGMIGSALAVLAIVWTLNLYNFMDGIDGLAASESVFVNLAGAFLIWQTNGSSILVGLALLVAASTLGFLIWNWPPAKIFMGDVGSGFLGFTISVLALATGRENHAMPYAWLVLGGAFFVDATTTLVRRLLRHERVYMPHRTHAYQWLSRRWKSHLLVTSLLWVVNVLWLFPIAWLCIQHPSYAPFLVCAGLMPLVLLALWAGSGRSEGPIVTSARM